MSFRFNERRLALILTVAAISLVSFAGGPSPAGGTADPAANRPAAADTLTAEAYLPATSGAGLVAPADEFQESEAWKRELRRSGVEARRAARPSALPTQTPAAAKPPAGAVTVPILMYHHIAIAGPDADAVRRDLSVTPTAFAAQLGYLAENGYHVVSLAALIDHLAASTPLPSNPVVLTFDDGYLDNYTSALPLLRARGFTATFFLITDFVGHGEYMSWENARELRQAGMDVGSHTVDHPDLSTLSTDRLLRQLSDSKQALQSQLGTPVSLLCYPSGRYSQAVMSMAAQAGYVGAVTTAYGDAHRAQTQMELSRIRVRGNDSMELFAVKVNGPAPVAPVKEPANLPKGF